MSREKPKTDWHFVGYLVLVFGVIIVISKLIGHPSAPVPVEETKPAEKSVEATSKPETTVQADAALKAIRAEPKVKDVLYQPGQAVEWQVGVLDDGTPRHGYASYICEVLSEQGADTADTVVRIVDIAKVANGTNFRDASLGSVRCRDGSRSMP